MKAGTDDVVGVDGGSAPTLAMIKSHFEQRRMQAAQDMKQLLANVDPSLAIF